MKTTLIIAIISTVSFSINLKAQDGQELFRANCGACHSVGKGKLVGPDLKGTHSKYEKPWLIKWIKSSQELVKAKDPIAVKLFEENGNIPMPDQALSDEQVESVISFIEAETARLDAPPVVEEKAPAANSGQQAAASVSEAGSNTMTYAFAILVALMLGVIAILGNIIKQISHEVRTSNKS